MGTVVTIVGSPSKVLHIPFLVNQYSVKLEPNFSRGLDIVLTLDRGMEGNLDGLNQRLFGRWEEKSDPRSVETPISGTLCQP